MMGDWIKLHRAFLRWEWFQKPEMVQLFIWLLLNASYKDYRYQGRVIKRGQVVTSQRAICKGIGLPQRVVRTCLDRLKSTGEIEMQPTHRFSVITICNYDSYQAEILETDTLPTHYRHTTDTLNSKKTTHQNSGLNDCDTNNCEAEILETDTLPTHSNFTVKPKTDTPIDKEDKNIIVVVDNARTREELAAKLRREFFASDIKQEHAAMSLRITKAQLLEVAERVFADWLATDIEPKEINMRHLLNHIAVKVEREAKGKPADKEQWKQELMIGAIKRRQKLK